MKLKDFIITALVIVIIYLFTCNKPKVITETKTVTRVDSLYFRDTIVQTIKVPKKELVFIKETPFNIDLSDTSELSARFSTYVYEQKDSLLEALISIEADKRPDKVSFEYEFKNFTLRDSIYVRDSVYNEVKKSFLSVGATLVGSKTSFGFAPVIQYSHKKGNNYSLGYDLINNQFHVGFSKKISH